jgi:hypothetical protein
VEGRLHRRYDDGAALLIRIRHGFGRAGHDSIRFPAPIAIRIRAGLFLIRIEALIRIRARLQACRNDATPLSGFSRALKQIARR